MSGEAERRVGTVIGGKWRVDTLLGSGSMAAVYAVTHRNGARAALKILHPTLCTDPAVCERFLGEGYLTNSVKHQGIVRVLDDGVTDDGCVFLVMDLLEGDTLEAFRQNRGGRLELVEALDMGDRLMDVLAAVHAAGIIHRDLKPQNVFICNDGAVKLLDFGVARVFDRGSQSQLSMFGLVLGTPSFMSPEQALGSRDKVDHRSDIWSLGATLFTSLTGETVHLGANMQAKLLAAATVKARSISMVMPELPAPIAAALDMALRFKKEDRWQTVETFRRAVRESRQKLGLGKPQSVAPPGFDLGLDEITEPVDSDHPKFNGSATVPIAPPLPRNVSSQPSAAAAMGTLIGIGVDDLARQEQQRQSQQRDSQPGRPPPLRPRLPSSPTPGAFTAGAVSAHAVVRSSAVSISPRASRPDGQEGSIPYGSTLRTGADETSVSLRAGLERRKGSVAVWVAAFALAAVAVGGIAFFAVHRGPLAGPVPPSSASTFPPAPTHSTIPAATGASSTPPSAPAPSPTSPVVPEASAITGAARQGGQMMKPVGVHVPRKNPARPAGVPSGPAVAPDVTATTTSEPAPTPKPAPSVQPDPFGTPE